MMFRRFLAVMLCLCVLPTIALAESMPLYQVFTFAGSLPERLHEPLSALIPDENRIISGAAIQYNSTYHDPDEPASWNAYSAMLIIDAKDGPLLLAAAWVDGMPWQVNDFTRFLRRKDNIYVSIYQPDPSRIPLFSVDYPDRSGMVSDLMLFRGNRLWQLHGHIDEAAGLHTLIDGHDATVIENGARDFYDAPGPFWMDYLADASGFPTTREDVEALDRAAASILVSSEAAGLAYTEGANLRTEPTAKSASLGMYNEDVPLTLTGEQRQGTSYPWLQMRIGNTVGWMSANYVHTARNDDFPVPLGRTVAGCPMYAAPGDAQPASQLAPGTTFHILTEIGGMYHICIPQGDISWDVDRNGTYGYISNKGILQGAGISALEALESAR